MRTIFLLIMVISQLLVWGQKKLSVAPPNPDYLQFIEEYRSGKDVYVAPSPYLMNFDQYLKFKDQKSPKNFPVAYDMRTAGPGGTSLLTSVKHQLSCGACWAFATCSSVESTWKIMGLGDNDLSENNLKNCHGFTLSPCQWGHHFMSTAYYVRGSGPVTESQDPYEPTNGQCLEDPVPTAFIPESRYLPEDHDAFKEAIMTTGAVYNTYRSEGSYYQWINGHYTYCYQGPNTTTHAIAIVGWNDTISTACGNGAWLCKNEYGENWGEDGFFYISYKDTLVLKYNSIWPQKRDYDPGLKIYNYDTTGGWPFVGYEDPVAYGLVKYSAGSDQFINEVGTYTVSYGTTLNVKIYRSFDGNTLSDLIATIPDTYCDNPGFWVLEIDEPFAVNSGETFYIQVKYNSPGLDFPIAVEGYDEGYNDPHIETGKCWSREENGSWEAWGSDTENNFDICIKAYGYDRTKLDLNVFLEGPFNGSLMNTDLQQLSGFPLSQPYSGAPWNYNGGEQLSEVPSGIVDWILVELRETEGDADQATAASVVARFAALLRNDGKIVDIDGISFPDLKLHITKNLYVVIYHRNHLPVISADPLSLQNGIYVYDFTDDINKAYGAGLAHKSIGQGYFGMISGDANANGLIDSADLINWKNSTGKKGYLNTDYDLNKEVNNRDKNELWYPNQNETSQIPE